MWILDARSRGDIELWVKDGGACRLIREKQRPYFHLHLPDPHAYLSMLEALERDYGAEERRFRTIYGWLDGYRVYAGRDVADRIAKHSHLSARLYDVDVRLEQRFMAERGLFPCGNQGESRLSPDFDMPLTSLKIEVDGNPQLDKDIRSIEVTDGSRRELEGGEKEILSDLFSLIGSADPDLILFPNADFWMHLMMQKAERYGLDQTFSRSGRLSKLDSKSYWSYGKVNYRAGAVLPEGRILIDTAKSFTYEAGGLRGVLLASRLTGLSPNLTSRFTPGTLVSSYEAYEAMRRGISIPLRKSDPERLRGFSELRAADRGGMMFQPLPGIHGRSYQIDFTSLYPTIIVKFDLSPESLGAHDGRGFLSEALEPLLGLRLITKSRKKTDPQYAGLDSVLKWMLVTCFGYTGYRNAKFGSIEVHERITSIARDTLLKVKGIAEDMGFEVLHGITDCLWVKGEPVMGLKERVERETGMPTEIETYDWLVFLDMADGGGAYNRYYGRLSDGSVKTRGLMANRHDSPPYVKRMQSEVLEVMGEAGTLEGLAGTEARAKEVRDRYTAGLRRADVKDLVVSHRIGQLEYGKNCAQASAIRAYGKLGVDLSAGMVIGYVVRDSKRWIVDTEWDAGEFDAPYYGRLLEKAWSEMSFAFERLHRKNHTMCSKLPQNDRPAG